jgi:superfamily II RNA helicase
LEPVSLFIFTQKACDQSAGETIPARMTWYDVSSNEREVEPAMSSRINQSNEQIDRATSRSICRGVGERLQRDLRPETSELPSDLQHLMDELRQQDRRN